MADTVMLYGTVVSGRGNASAVIRGNMDELTSALGTELVQGSLNLVLQQPVKLAPARSVSVDGGRRLFWPATIEAIGVWAYRWPHAPLHVLEVVAPVRLREALGLSDGSPLTLTLDRADTVDLTLTARAAWAAWWYGRGPWYYTGDVYKEYAKRFCKRVAATQPGISRNR
jgi:hypothetical protein